MSVASNCPKCKYMADVKTLVRQYSVYVCDGNNHKIPNKAVFVAFGYDKPPNTPPIKVYTKAIDEAKTDTKSQLWQKASICYNSNSAPRADKPKDEWDSPEKCCCGAKSIGYMGREGHQGYCNYKKT